MALKNYLRPISVCVFTGIGLAYYFKNEREIKSKHNSIIQIFLESLNYGKPLISTGFELTDNFNRIFKSDHNNQYKLIYFGFTHCPDVCPEELDKMTHITQEVNAALPQTEDHLLPIFITVDPKRDTPDVLTEYLKDFYPRFLGLTGTEDKINQILKNFRVYSRKSNTSTDNQNYLLDHSIYIYFISKDGSFVDIFGRDKTVKQCSESILKEINKKRSK